MFYYCVNNHIGYFCLYYLYMFTKLYINTTNPQHSLTDVLKNNYHALLLSIIFHTFIYILFINLFFFIFYGRTLKSSIQIRLIIVLLIIMSLGYIARHLHVQDIYKAYDKDVFKTREHIDKFFISWVFLG